MPDTCDNCRAPLAGPYCHDCGQTARTPIQPTRQLLAALGRELFDLDNRLVRSVKALIFRPGFLTVEYVAGRRKTWTTPLQLYLLSALIYFVVAEWSGTSSFLFITATDENTLIVEWLPRILFLVIPAFAFFDWLLFDRSSRLWAENLIFSIHLHAGWFLLATIPAAGQPSLEMPLEEWQWVHYAIAVPVAIAQIWIWVYLWKSLRRFHGRGVFGTLVRLPFLVILHSGVMAALLFVVFSALA